MTSARQASAVVALIVAMAGGSCAPVPSAQPSEHTPTPTPPPSASPSESPQATVVRQTTVKLSTGPAAPELDAISFAPDALHGWAGGAGTILGTSDGGTSWH